MNPTPSSVGKCTALRREIVRKLREVGLLGTVAHAAQKVVREAKHFLSPGQPQPDPFDAQFGTDTAGRIGVGSLDIPDEKLAHVRAYQGVDPEFLLGVLQELHLPYERFVFVDLGSGKGRALLLASRFPFKEIVGVELSAQLCEIARQNLSRYRDPLQKCKRCRVICQDAVNYEPPADDMVLFLYNSFDEEIMRTVNAKIEAALRAKPREIYLIYLNPTCRQLWDQSALFQAIQRTERHVVYKSDLP